MRQPKHVYNSRYRNKLKGKRAQARARRNWQCKRKYGISLVEREQMYQTQCGLCGLCGEPLPKEVMTNYCDLDHCHTTKRIRALVHRRCNHLIAAVENQQKLIPAVLTYLDKHSGS